MNYKPYHTFHFILINFCLLSGGDVTVALTGADLSLDWSDVFRWQGKGKLLYVLHVGTQDGSANQLTGKYSNSSLHYSTTTN